MSHVVSSNCLHIGIDIGLKSGWLAVVFEEDGKSKLMGLKPLYCGSGANKEVMPAAALLSLLGVLKNRNPFQLAKHEKEDADACERKWYVENMPPNMSMIGHSASVIQHFSVIIAFLELLEVYPHTIHPNRWQKYITHLDNEDSEKYKESVQKPSKLHKKIIHNWVEHNVPCSEKIHSFSKICGIEDSKFVDVSDAYKIPASYGYADAIAIAYLGEKITEQK